ncbi:MULTISPECIES: 16S rRNA (cytidine(1402)-2'-O)-methyltransferase [Dyadobacter]|uniref:Ribosomal RNA small subunit methyltransferase I n=1 Tax=Dyadobacter chenhuakuii TaxID=2909339 RepID=A0ABY4XT77_9BACT|nr:MULTISPECIES: 16S rRNA (cytidine(1402)-2'-O)-methyltransferase [Dyadobacter]MCE7069872.1 16S rRNA (cytidine(1402)-2'-O)-methyltransferase [Dyadobacter sp. CY327]MCF2492194.1 16S rRNA (cytidine(1402)-2'-O)-methyltransferase [Dyadobacter chenhuakuii]MCF2516836.1 16S rRNA (cytidine(1402)-2'-O)-methyltransferase [Dyadobacter sp. CY351]USJ33498.1 16S rRNA (cytidine(1402)-2'-O)-methyltransferase [Dyadobacter chenhuakuii]
MKLYIVPTPIGNLEDITLRAINVLKSVDVVLAEDTRTSGSLLKHLGISKPMHSYHIHNEHQTVTRVVERILKGESMALVSDAGTPAVSDPGFLLVRECIKQGIQVECLPGPTAFVPALVNSGLPSDRFTFEGFLPHKKGRQTRLQNLASEERTMIFYESPHRLIKALQQFVEFFGADRQVSVARELTKIYEENVRGTLEEVIAYFSEKTIKGEIVIILAGKAEEKKKSDKYED